VTGVLPADAGSARFSLVLPTTWEVLDLDPETRDRSIERMIRAALGTSDRLARLRRSATVLYRTAMADAVGAGGFFAATLSQSVQGHPLTASALAFLGTLPLGSDGGLLSLEEMAELLAEPVAGETPVGDPVLVDLPIGRAVRSRGRSGSGMRGTDGREPVVDVTRFFVPVPEWGLMLAMVFSTPILPAADAFAELFDQLAKTARWRW
jgi:hypothetical protein